MLVLGLSLAWLAGVFLGSVAPYLPIVALLFFAALLASGAVRWRGRRKVLLGCLALCVLTLGFLRYQDHDQRLGQDPLADVRDSGTVRVRGVVVQEPEEDDIAARWVFRVTALQLTDALDWEARAGLIQVYSRWLPRVRYGDELQLEGKLQTPPRFDRFDYREYLARQGVHIVLRYPHARLLGPRQDSSAQAALAGLRRQLADRLRDALPEPQSALAQGVLLSIRSGIPETVKEEFRRTATTHILAISGHNLSVIAGILVGWGTWLFGRRRLGYFLSVLLVIWFYAALVGFVPSVVRAAIMASLVILAGSLGRQSFAPLALTFAAAVMTVADPFLLWDIGFQLSFLAMVGIVSMVPLLQNIAGRLLRSRPPLPGPIVALGRFAGPAVAATSGATLATLPVLALNFQMVPFAALPATLFALPALPFILLPAFATALLGFLSPVLAAIPAAVTWVASSYMLQVVHWWALVPVASIQVPPAHPFWGWGYLGLLAIALWLGYRWRGMPAHEEAVPRRSLGLREWLSGAATRSGWLLSAVVVLVLAANAAAWALALQGGKTSCASESSMSSKETQF